MLYGMRAFLLLVEEWPFQVCPEHCSTFFFSVKGSNNMYTCVRVRVRREGKGEGRRKDY